MPLEELSSIYDMIGALTTVLTVIIAYLAITSSSKAHEAQLALTAMDEYATDQMTRALSTILECVRAHKEDYVSWWHDNRMAGDADADAVTTALRLLKGYFEGPVRVHLDGLLSYRAVKSMTRRDGLAVYLKYGVPLELAWNRDYDLRAARFLRQKILKQTPSRGRIFGLDVGGPDW